MRQYFHDVLIIGTGAAGYDCAGLLRGLGKEDVAMVTEGKDLGTSRNAGSDKQTFYKLALSSASPDSVAELAEDLFRYGGVDGDVALAMAAGSVQSFMRLVELGVPFPKNEYGEFVGYQTDHSVRQRATSAGPLTSRYMTEALERQALERGVRLYDGLSCVKILTDGKRVRGIVCFDMDHPAGPPVLFACNALVVAAGGEPGVYASTVYPDGQSGCMGVLADAGITLANLQHWQYGLASVGFKWNLSGSYQQALPRYISVDPAGKRREFLREAYACDGDLLRDIFRKGYEWPFDVKKMQGSSKIDLLVLEELRRGNRVFLDYTADPAGLEAGVQAAGQECYTYLKNCGALQGRPIQRLQAMNPAAVRLYRDHGIDLAREPLEIGVCAQHQNGGAYVDCNWQSDLPGLYVIGEAAGTFGPYRPGGSALAAGQVGAMRCAEHIAQRPLEPARDLPPVSWGGPVRRTPASPSRPSPGEDIPQRMDRYAGILRNLEQMEVMVHELAAGLMDPLEPSAGLWEWKDRNRRRYQYELLRAFLFAAREQGSVGGAVCMDAAHSLLPATRGRENKLLLSGQGGCRLVEPRPIPVGNQWFEAVWNGRQAP